MSGDAYTKCYPATLVLVLGTCGWLDAVSEGEKGPSDANKF